MGEHTTDPDVFIRSVSSRGHVGGLSTQIVRIVDVLDAAGWGVILLETVGTGQSETEVAGIADVCVVVNAPGLGDDVQAIKAGILEIADVLVVNKADNPLAETTARQLKSMLGLRPKASAQVPVISTVATEGRGVTELLTATRQCGHIKDHGDRRSRSLQRTRRLIAQLAAKEAASRVLDDDSESASTLLSSVVEGVCEPEEAAREFLTSRYGDNS